MSIPYCRERSSLSPVPSNTSPWGKPRVPTSTQPSTTPPAWGTRPYKKRVCYILKLRHPSRPLLKHNPSGTRFPQGVPPEQYQIGGITYYETPTFDGHRPILPSFYGVLGIGGEQWETFRQALNVRSTEQQWASITTIPVNGTGLSLINDYDRISLTDVDNHFHNFIMSSHETLRNDGLLFDAINRSLTYSFQQHLFHHKRDCFIFIAAKYPGSEQILGSGVLFLRTIIQEIMGDSPNIERNDG